MILKLQKLTGNKLIFLKTRLTYLSLAIIDMVEVAAVVVVVGGSGMGSDATVGNCHVKFLFLGNVMGDKKDDIHPFPLWRFEVRDTRAS